MNFALDIGPFQSDLNDIFSWTVHNCTLFNTDKCYYSDNATMSFVRTTAPQLCFNEKSFRKIDSLKDLGFTINSNLSGKPHIEKAVTKTIKVLIMLKRKSLNVPAYTSKIYTKVSFQF